LIEGENDYFDYTVNARPFPDALLQESLAYARARRDVPALVSAAEAHFGSWGKALYAAGIDQIVHHKWRKPRASDKS